MDCFKCGLPILDNDMKYIEKGGLYRAVHKHCLRLPSSIVTKGKNIPQYNGSPSGLVNIDDHVVGEFPDENK